LVEKRVGFKIIALRCSRVEVLIGGEESGGVGWGAPARAAIALLVPALGEPWWRAPASGEPARRLRALRRQRLRPARLLRLKDMASGRPEASFAERAAGLWLGSALLEASNTDGLKLRWARAMAVCAFSGRTVLARLYCEAQASGAAVLAWARSSRGG